MLKLILFFKHIKSFHFRKFYNNKYKNGPLKLHLGCGKKYKKGWINIDNNSDNNIEKLDINYNLAKGIPFKDNTIDYIYNEHFIEHLYVKHAESFLKECKRVLKHGGILRIATPDLYSLINGYKNENWLKESKEFFDKYNMNFIRTKAELINISFHWWGHKWLYDKEELERRLKDVGFKKIEFCINNESVYNELKGLETLMWRLLKMRMRLNSLER